METQKDFAGVIARFKCACGHTSPGMLYADESFAASDRETQEASACIACVYGISPEEFERRAQLARNSRGVSFR